MDARLELVGNLDGSFRRARQDAQNLQSVGYQLRLVNVCPTDAFLVFHEIHEADKWLNGRILFQELLLHLWSDHQSGQDAHSVENDRRLGGGGGTQRLRLSPALQNQHLAQKLHKVAPAEAIFGLLIVADEELEHSKRPDECFVCDCFF